MKTAEKQTTQETKKEKIDPREDACLEILRELKKKTACEIIQRDLDAISLLTLGCSFLIECMLLLHEWTGTPLKELYDVTLSKVRVIMDAYVENNN